MNTGDFTESSKPFTLVHAVIVTFNPDTDLLSRQIDALLNQVHTVWVVDNASVKRPELQAYGCQVNQINFPENRGVGSALNAGLAQALAYGASYALLMDQDSIPATDMVSHLQEMAVMAEKAGMKLAAVGSSYGDDFQLTQNGFVRLGWLGYVRTPCDGREACVEVDFLISSGTLMSLRALQSIGFMDESLFIDHVDTEWCFRAKAKGYRLFGACSARMVHSLGNERRRFWFGRWRIVSFHAPFRYYYICRNSLLLLQKPYLPWRWRIAECLRLLRVLYFYALFSEQRICCIKMMMRGLRDGLHGKTGKLVL